MPMPKPVNTRGLTHLALAVRDLDRSATFYRRVLGAIVVYRGAGFVQLQTPGAWDVLVLEESPAMAGQAGGIVHFGFRLTSPSDLPKALAAVEAAGGTITESGEFVPGEPYLFAKDPDGYTIELWYELPTKVDPKPQRSSNQRSSKQRSSNQRSSKQRSSKGRSSKQRSTQTRATSTRSKTVRPRRRRTPPR